jgi:N-hydroxyarylamine O-acetyltransferase
MPLPDATINRLLARIGLDQRPAADAAGLRTVHRAYLRNVPYEDLAVQLRESRPLDPEQLAERVLAGGRGGYCFETNTVLMALLEGVGFRVERRQAIVGVREAHADGEPTNHLALIVTLDDGAQYLADAGWGEGPLEPLPVRAHEPHTEGRLRWTLERYDGDDGWWVNQHRWGSTPGFWFSDAPAQLADFAPHHQRLSTSPDSGFVKTLVVQKPGRDRIVTLRARTLSHDGPDLRARRILPDQRGFAAALHGVFGIDPAVLGGERVARLWRQACEQHAAHAARPPRVAADAA